MIFFTKSGSIFSAKRSLEQKETKVLVPFLIIDLFLAFWRISSKRDIPPFCRKNSESSLLDIKTFKARIA